MAAPVTGSEKYPTMLRSGTKIPLAKNHHDPPAFRYAHIDAAARHAPSSLSSLPGHVLTQPAMDFSAMISAVKPTVNGFQRPNLMRR